MYLPDRIRTYIEDRHLMPEGGAVLVALSGGADSVALLLVLLELGYRVSAYHLNHMLRGRDAELDEAYCRKICERYQVPLFCERVDVTAFSEKEKMSFEDAGRTARYRGLAGIVDAHRIGCVATGHHMGDSAETFFMNAMRGSGLDGLCSIPAESTRRVVSASGKDVLITIVRPLLRVRRCDIESYLKSKAVEWREDLTNEDGHYLRNRVRKLLDDGAVKKVNDCIALLQNDRDFIDAYVDDHFKRYVRGDFDSRRGCVYILSPEGSLHISVMSRLIRRIVGLLIGDTVNLSSKNIDAVLSLERVGGVTEIGTGDRKVLVYRSYDGLEFTRSSEEGCTEKGCAEKNHAQKGRTEEERTDELRAEEHGVAFGEVNVCGIRKNEESVCGEEWKELRDERSQPRGRVRMRLGSGKEFDAHKMTDTRIAIDMRKVKGELRVRSRKVGDEIVPFGMKGKKTLKKLMIDEKVDRRLRDCLPVVVDDEKVVWVAGVRMSELVRVGRGAEVAFLDLTDFL